MKLERGTGLLRGIRDLRPTASNVTAAVTGMIYSVSGIVIIFSNVAAQAGMSQRHVLSWLMTGFFVGGLLSILLSLAYKQPIVLASSLPAVALVGTLFTRYGLEEMVGGFVVSGLLILLVGLTGAMDLLKRTLPIPIVMGMVAGIFMDYAITLVREVAGDFWVCGIIVTCYFLAVRFLPRVSAQMVALAVAVALVLLVRMPELPPGGMALGFAAPLFVRPVFTVGGVVSIAVPLTLLAVADCIKGYGVLKANGYEPPMNTLVSVSGAASMLAGLSLSHPITFAGAGTAIVAAGGAEDRDTRYGASVIKNCFSVLLALLIGFVYPLLSALPVSVSNVLAGLAMLSLFTSSLESAFSGGRYRTGAFAALAVGLSGITVLGVGAPVWALAAGLLVSLLAEPGDFDGNLRAGERGAKSNPLSADGTAGQISKEEEPT